jgi:hypothetical protein
VNRPACGTQQNFEENKMKIKSMVVTSLFAFTLMAQAATAFAASKTFAADSQAKTAACCPGCPECNGGGGSCCRHKA